jgi:hypothetical protein
MGLSQRGKKVRISTLEILVRFIKLKKTGRLGFEYVKKYSSSKENIPFVGK